MELVLGHELACDGVILMLSMSDVWLKFAERVSHTQRDTRLVSLLNIGVSGLGLGTNTPQEDKRESS